MPTPSSRDKMILSATLLLREQGYTGTSFGDVLAHSGAPRGSIYHHFPGGKGQLVEEAVGFAGAHVDRTLRRAQESGDAVGALRAFFAGWRTQLVDSGFRAGCPVVAVAAEAHDDAPALLDATAAAFASWTTTLAGLLVAEGVPAERAARLARLVVAAIEGAVVLCRADRSTAALDDVETEVLDLLRAAVA